MQTKSPHTTDQSMSSRSAKDHRTATRRWVPVLSLALLLVAGFSVTTPSYGQDDPDRRQERRRERLERIERAIEEIEKRLGENLPENAPEALRKEMQQALGQFQLMEPEASQRRYVIGVTLEMQANAEGLGDEVERQITIGSVADDSPAAKAGIQAGDEIVAVNGDELRSLEALVQAVQETEGETPLSLTLERGEKTVEVEVTPQKREVAPGEAPDAPQADRAPLQFLVPGEQGGRFQVLPGIRTTEGMGTRLESLENEVRELKEQVQQLTEAIKQMQKLVEKGQ